MRIAVRRLAPSRIPMSNGRLQSRNYYLIYLRHNGDGNSLDVTSVDHQGVVAGKYCKYPDCDIYRSELCIPNKKINEYEFEIIAFIREIQLTYKSALVFLIHKYTFYPWITIYADRIRQFLFNQRNVSSQKRIKVLRHIIGKTLEDPNYCFNQVGIAVEIHGKRVVHHPSWNLLIAQYRTLIDSLVDSGEIERKSSYYRILPRALKTLEEYEEEERKHTEQIRIQFLIAVIALIQIFSAFISM